MYPEYRKGFVLTVLGVLIFTPDALLIRLTNLEFFSLTVGRGTIGGLVMLLGLALYYRRNFKKQILAIGGWGLILAGLQGSFTWTFYGALKNTSVANVLVFLASVPLIAALMTKMFLQDEIQKPTWIAIGVVGFGLLIVGSRGLIVGNWLGDLMALLNAVIIAGFFTVVRGRSAVNLIPDRTWIIACCIGCVSLRSFSRDVIFSMDVSDSRCWIRTPGCIGITDARSSLYPDS